MSTSSDVKGLTQDLITKADQTQSIVHKRDWAAGINLAVDTDEDVKEFIRNRIEAYKLDEHQGEDLWWDFYDDFKEFTILQDFLRVGIELPRKLRDTLRSRGVYIPKDKNSISGNLLALIKLDKPPIWPDSDKEFKRVNKMLGFDTNYQQNIFEDKEKKKYLSTDSVNKKARYRDENDSYPVQGTTQLRNAPPLTNMSDKGIDMQNSNYDEERISKYNPHGYSKELANLKKLYDNETKYSGNGDAFDYKFDIFLRNCENADVPASALEIAFPIMLKEEALDFYHSFYSSWKNMNLEDLCSEMKRNFEGLEYNRTLLTKWNKLTFESIVDDKKNIGKTVSECLKILVQKLRTMQHGLDESLRNDAFIHNKIVTSCERQVAFKNVCERPSNTISGLLSDLRSAAEFHDRTQSSSTYNDQESLFTDRRYHQNKKPNYQTNRYQGSKNNLQRKPNFFYKNNGPQNACVVCSKQGCWSTNHPKSEREEAFEKIKRDMKNKLSNFSQYCLDVEGEPPSFESDAESVIDEDKDSEDLHESFIFDTEILEKSPKQFQSTFLTDTLDEIDGPKVVMALANKATSHALLGVNNKSDLQQISNRYGPNNFEGIVIDTGAAHYSTGGHEQWMALQKSQYTPIDKSTSGTVNVQFGIGSTSSIGSVKILTPIGRIQFHIVEVNTPFLLCLRDLDKNGAYYNNLTDRVHCGEKSFPVVRRYGHAFLTWGDNFVNYITNTAYLSESNLRQLHRRFGHPSVRRFLDLMARSDHHEVDVRILIVKPEPNVSFG